MLEVLHNIQTVLNYFGVYFIIGLLPCPIIGHIVADTAEIGSIREITGEVIAVSPIIAFVVWLAGTIILAVIANINV